MKLPVFLYNFSKIYIPAVFILCLFSVGLDHLPKTIKIYEPKTIIKNNPPQQNIPRQLTPPQVIPPPQVIHREADPPQPKTIEHPQPVEPKYFYLVEFTSGRSMRVDDIKVENNLAHFLIHDGYNMTVPESEIKSIRKFKL